MDVSDDAITTALEAAGFRVDPRPVAQTDASIAASGRRALYRVINTEDPDLVRRLVCESTRAGWETFIANYGLPRDVTIRDLLASRQRWERFGGTPRLEATVGLQAPQAERKAYPPRRLGEVRRLFETLRATGRPPRRHGAVALWARIQRRTYAEIARAATPPAGAFPDKGGQQRLATRWAAWLGITLPAIPPGPSHQRAGASAGAPEEEVAALTA